jgi:hypothetical protein
MVDFSALFDGLKQSAVDLAKEAFEDQVSSARKDAQAFLDDSREKLERWTKLLVDQQLDKDEFEMLVRSLKTSAKMELLLQKGIAKIKLDRFVKSLLNLVIDTVFKAIA